MWSALLVHLGTETYPRSTTDPVVGRSVLILGLGNILLQDEGVGVRVVEQLQRQYRISGAVEVLDGGTAGMSLLEHIRNRDHLIVVDAVKTGQAPGTVITLSGKEVPAFFQSRVSPHQMGLADMLAALELMGEKPAEVTVIGVEPQNLDIGLELSDLVSTRVDELVIRLVGKLLSLGFEVDTLDQPQRGTA
jgi:hydrogenase maturation protease